MPWQKIWHLFESCQWSCILNLNIVYTCIYSISFQHKNDFSNSNESLFLKTSRKACLLAAEDESQLELEAEPDNGEATNQSKTRTNAETHERNSVYFLLFSKLFVRSWSLKYDRSCLKWKRRIQHCHEAFYGSILRRCQELSYELNTAEQLLFKRRETLFLHE